MLGPDDMVLKRDFGKFVSREKVKFDSSFITEQITRYKDTYATLTLCPDCELGELPLIRSFILEDAPLFEDLEIIYDLTYKHATLSFYYDNNTLLKTIDITNETSIRIINILAEYGIF